MSSAVPTVPARPGEALPLHVPPLATAFQPIVRFESADLLGYEALLRGPAGTELAMPDALFRLAATPAQRVELEIRAARTAFKRFAELELPGLLFVNFSPMTLRHLLDEGGRRMAALLPDTVSANRVVVELTEQTRIGDMAAFHEAMTVMRGLGMRYALDDFGSGHANLDMLVELTPHYVKLDKSLVRGIAACSRRLEVMRALLKLLASLGAGVIAEGIEDGEELAVLRDLGVPFGQGFHLGRPLFEPPLAAPSHVIQALESSQIAVFPQAVRTGWGGPTAAQLMRPAPTVTAGQSNNDVLALFQAHPGLHAVAVVDEQGRPVGIINRQSFTDRYAAPFHRELYGKKACILMARREPVCFDKSATLEAMAKILANGDQRYLADGFIVTDGGRHIGLGTGAELIRAVTEIRMEAARYANPLTFLPGNIPLNQHIERLLEAGAAFFACYADLNNFKPFNDQYGYWKGDEMIKGAAAVLADVCDPGRDFLGHVGGDDFLVLFQSADWQVRVHEAIQRFNRAARELYNAADRAAGGIHGEDRHGHMAFFPMVSMAIGAVRVPPATELVREGLPAGIRRLGSSHVGAAAAAAKRDAKKQPSGFALVELAPLLADAGVSAGVRRY